MLREVISALKLCDGGVYVDATLGRGGYADKMLESAHCQVIAFDRDHAAMAAGQRLQQHYGQRFAMHHAPFAHMAQHITHPVQGVVFDLGVSSPQLDDGARGFSFRHDGPLDMRMDQREGETAADLVNTKTERELADIFFHLGEEKRARQIAKKIVAQRAQQPITRTHQLAELVRSVVKGLHSIDPATRTFQALRIAVNDELGQLKVGLAAAEKILAPHGRLVVVSFHSLEDRIVKQFLSARAKPAATSRHLPVNDNQPKPSFTLVGSQPHTPTDAESKTNPRARSARLRVAERTTAPIFPAEEVA